MHRAVLTVFFLWLGLSGGCSPKVQFTSTPQDLSFDTVEGEILSVKNVDWEFPGKITLSKGLRLDIKFPPFSSDQVREMNERKKVDAWMIRVNRVSPVRKQELGRFLVSIGGEGPEKATFQIYYSAAAIGPRFERFACPAFDHNRYLSKFEKGRTVYTKKHFSLVDGNPFIRELPRTGLSVVTMNGGESLLGEYYVEVALFSQKERMMKSDFIALDSMVEVKEEGTRPMKNCANFKIPESGTGRPGAPTNLFKR